MWNVNPIHRGGAKHIIKDVNKHLEDRKAWLQCLTSHVRPGTIVELGCGSGFVLEELSNDFPESTIVGVDKDMERLKNVLERHLKNVVPVNADITHTIFPPRTFDTALLVGTLHEIFSTLGRGMVQDALERTHNVLKEDGVLLIQDFLKPSPRPVEMAFKIDQTRRRFRRFADEFRPRDVRFEKTGHGVRLDIADAIEFISKYRSPTEEDWQEEMGETHFFFAEEEYREEAIRAGFIVKDTKRLPKGETWWAQLREDIELEFEPEYQWIQLVLIK